MYLTNFRKRKTQTLVGKQKKAAYSREQREKGGKKVFTSVQDIKKENESLIRKLSVKSAIKENILKCGKHLKKKRIR